MSMVIAHTMPYLNFADVLQKHSTTLHKLNCYTTTKYKKIVTQKHEHHTNINWSTGSSGNYGYATKKFPYSLGRGCRIISYKLY